MNTLLLSPELFLHEGGIARIMRLYLKALCELAVPGQDKVVSISLNDRPGEDRRAGAYANAALQPLIGCGHSKARFVQATLRHAHRDSRIVCGHLHQLPVAWLAAKLRPGLRYFLVAHGIEVWRPFSRLETRALHGADSILCISDYTRRQLRRFCPSLEASRLLVIPNTFDPVLAAAHPVISNPPDPLAPRLLCVSRLTQADSYKGVDTLIEALPSIRIHHPRAQLRIVGDGDDSARLQTLVRQLGLAEAVVFTGRIDDDALRAEYEACDLFVLPSRREGFGLVYLEAMIHGKPCLAARAGGAPEVINEHVGAIADYGDIPGIVAAVSDLVTHPRDPGRIRAHAHTFAFPSFTQRLAASLRSAEA